MAAQNKLRTKMAQQFLEALQQDQLPWKACWQQTRPQNAITGKLYRGVNALYLSYAADELGYTDPRWCTYTQVQKQGWRIKKGSEAARVEYWAYFDLKQKKLLSWSDVKDLLSADPDYQENLQLRSRVYPVFNGQQIDGIPAWERAQSNTDIGTLRQQRDTLISNMGIGYEEYGQRAYYSPGSDTVTLPPEASFDDTYSYMATFLHECGHATGHHSRMDRNLTGGKGSIDYAREELRAEIASAFTAQALGLQLTDEQLQSHMQQHIAYVQNWIEVLQKSPDELFRAIKTAEAISDYLIEKGEFELTIDQESSSGKSSIPTPATPESSIDHIAARHTDCSITTMTDAHKKYLLEAADRGRYTNEKGEPLPRPTSTLTPPSMLQELAPKYPWANRDQLDEIAAGLLDNLSPEQLALYAHPEYTAIQMNSLRYAVQDNLPMDHFMLLSNPAFDSVQMDVLRACFQSGMTMAQMADFAKPEVPAQQMLDAYWNAIHTPDHQLAASIDIAPEA